jgi:hypothetical protein
MLTTTDASVDHETADLQAHERRKAVAIQVLREWAEQHEIPWHRTMPAREPIA